MIEYKIIKKEFSSKVESFTDAKDITFIKKGVINFENIRESSSEVDIFKIPQENQKELNEKGETEFMIVTKTIVNLNKK